MKKLIEGDAVIKHLQEKWKKPCPMCEHEDWTVEDHAYVLMRYYQGAISLGGGPAFIVVPVVCVNCGNTMLVNPLVVDLVDERSTSKEQSDG